MLPKCIIRRTEPVGCLLARSSEPLSMPGPDGAVRWRTYWVHNWVQAIPATMPRRASVIVSTGGEGGRGRGI